MAGRGLALSTARESTEKYVFRKTYTHLALVLTRGSYRELGFKIRDWSIAVHVPVYAPS
jgi:hypothetical protein